LHRNPEYLTSQLINQITSRNTAFLEKLTATQLVKKLHSKINCRTHKSPPLVPILSQINSVHILPSYFIKSVLFLSLNLCLGLPSGLFPSRIPIKAPYAFFKLSRACYIPQPPYLPSFHHCNNIWGRIKIKKLSREHHLLEYEAGRISEEHITPIFTKKE
jgi:hypothetical protein